MQKDKSLTSTNKILDRIMTRDLYKFVGEIVVDGNYKLDK